MKHFHLIITAIDKPLYDGEAISVTVPGIAGEMTILQGHEPLISLLKEGIITLRKSDGEETFSIESGVLEITREVVTILV